MHSLIVSNEEAKQKILNATKIMKDLVCSTLGPKGKYVIVRGPYQNPSVTKDGVTVANTIVLEQEVENNVIRILREAASKTVSKVGDGTTTATLLAASLLEVSAELEKAGFDSNEVRRVFTDLSKQAVEMIKKQSRDCQTVEQLQQIAFVSSNNDEELSKIISEAVYAAKESGIVLVEDSKSVHTTVEVINGFKIDRGFISPYFMTNPEKYTSEYSNPLILVTDKKIRSTQDIVPIMQLAAKHDNRPLLIIADDVEAQALALMVTNRVRASFPILAIKAPSYGQNRSENLKDIAIYTGAKFFSEDKGDKLSKCTLEDLGTIDKVITNVNETTLVGEPTNKGEVAKRVEELKAVLPIQDHEWKKEFIQKRIASLLAAIAVIYVGGKTEIEMKETKYRIDDALQATQTAFKSGLVIGGGVALIQAAKELEKHLELLKFSEGDTKIAEAFIDVLKEPFRMILKNAHIDYKSFLEHIINSPEVNIGYDVNQGMIVNMIESGIIDPTEVVTSALTAATSAACMLLNTSAIIGSSIFEQRPDMDYGDQS